MSELTWYDVQKPLTVWQRWWQSDEDIVLSSEFAVDFTLFLPESVCEWEYHGYVDDESETVMIDINGDHYWYPISSFPDALLHCEHIHIVREMNHVVIVPCYTNEGTSENPQWKPMVSYTNVKDAFVKWIASSIAMMSEDMSV